MAATVIINEFNGAPPGSKSDKTSGTVRFKNADDATVDLINPLVVPSAGQEYSFEKWLRLESIDWGGATQIDNLRAYSDGANNFGAGIKVWYDTTGTYQAPAIPNEANDPPESSVGGSPQVAMTDFFLRTSGDPIDMDAINAGPFTDGSPTIELGDFLVLVMEVETIASNGVLGAETLTFAYDEI
ncbi:MAG: hypothetical protein ACE5KF_01105 [Kiloniellaceae bacterium]